MKLRDVVTGLVILVILVTSVLLIKKARVNKLQAIPSPTPSVEQRVSNKFGGLTIPDDIDKAELTDVSGGNAFGIATKGMVLADLPEPGDGNFYQVWEETGGRLTLLGKMRIAKGGYLFEGKITGSKVIVTLGEKRILEGSF